MGAMEDKAATELTLTAYDDAVMKQASTKLESNQFVAFGVKLTREERTWDFEITIVGERLTSFASVYFI